MATPENRPNVVVFFTDQQRWDTTGVHGNPMGLTPNFDRVAQEGTHCYNACSCQPVCKPVRLSLQTGTYASRFNAYHNGSTELPADATTIAHCFQDAGYTTGYIGKWHLGRENPVPRERRTGYDYWLAAEALEHTSDAYHTTVYDNEGQPVNLPGYRVDGLTDAAIRFISDNQDEPFFLFTSFLEPHFQNHRDDYPAPTGYEERYLDCWMPPDLRALGGSAARHLPGYYGMVKRLDEAFGRVLDALKSLGLEENTIVVFTTDHGCHFKTRNGEYKRSCHDASIRVPLALQGPGFDGGGRLKDMISLVDLPPTLMDACNVPIPESVQGRSFLPLTKGKREGWREEAYVEIFDPPYLCRAVRTQRWKYAIKRKEEGLDDLSSWTFVEDSLYDLRADPYELNNLIGLSSHRHVADVLKERLVRNMRDAGEREPEIENAPEGGSGQKSVSQSESYE